MWSSKFLVEVAVKFGVLLAVARNEAQKSPRNPANSLVLTCVSDARKIIEKENGRFKFFEVICTLLHPAFIRLDLHWLSSISPKKNSNEHMLQGILLEEYAISLWD